MTSLTLKLRQITTTDEAIQEWLKNPVYDPLLEIDQALSSYEETLPENLHEQAKQLLDQAEYFLSKTDHPYLHPPSFFSELFELLISFVEMVFDIFGVQKLFGSPEHEWQEEQKSYKLMNLISFVGMISTQVLPILGMEEGQKKVAVVLTAIMGLSLIYPRIQPTPRALPRGQNLTRAIEKGDVEILEADK